MKKHTVPFRDRLVAGAIDRASEKLLENSYATQKFLAIDVATPVPVHWQMADQNAADTPEQHWARFDGNPNSGRWAARYKTAGVIATDKAIFEAEQITSGGEPAVGYSIGQAMMVGVLPEAVSFVTVEEPDQPAELQVGMGIGRGLLKATMGLWHSDDRTLSLPVDATVRAVRTNNTFDIALLDMPVL